MGKRVKIKPVDHALQPTTQLLIKLGSLIVHYQEWTSANGTYHDKAAINTLEQDAEVQEWLTAMSRKSLLPVKR